MSEEQLDATSTDAEQVKQESLDIEAPLDGEETLGDAGKRALEALKAELREARSLADSRLGEGGKSQLDEYKTKAQSARQQAADYQKQLAKLQAEIALKDKPAEEQAIEAAKQEARAEATQKANLRILKADLRAAATGKLADPTDAALYLDLSTFDVSDDGEVDSDALATAIAELIERKPHLAAQKQNRFDGAADQGAKGKDSTPPQWTEADLARATDDETVAAKAAGKLNNLLGIKT